MSTTNEPVATDEPNLTAEEIVDRFKYEAFKVAVGVQPTQEFYRTAISLGVAEITALKEYVTPQEWEVPKLLDALNQGSDVPPQYAELSRRLAQIGAVYLATDTIMEHMVNDGYSLDASLLSAIFA